MTNKDNFVKAIRLLDEGNVTAAGDIITILGPFLSQLLEEQDANEVIITHPLYPGRQFIVQDEGNGPYLTREPCTIDLGTA